MCPCGVPRALSPAPLAFNDVYPCIGGVSGAERDAEVALPGERGGVASREEGVEFCCFVACACSCCVLSRESERERSLLDSASRCLLFASAGSLRLPRDSSGAECRFVLSVIAAQKLCCGPPPGPFLFENPMSALTIMSSCAIVLDPTYS